MIKKFISLIASVILLFTSSAEIPVIKSVLKEAEPQADEYRFYDEINGTNGTTFYIGQPDEDSLNTVNAEVFGLSETAEDNFTAFQSALDFCRENPHTKLVINKGTYYFRNTESLVIRECRDLIIDGSGAEFIFCSSGYKIRILGSDCVRICNLVFDWNWYEDPLASVVTVRNADKSSHTLDLEYKIPAQCRENADFKAITQCDPESFTFGITGQTKEVYFINLENPIKSVTKISDNVIRIVHDGCMDGFCDGETYILRHYVYDGTIFNVTDYSKSLAFDNIDFYGSPGMCFICEGNCSHFQITDCFIGVDPEHKNERSVSAAADAIHIVNTNGCFSISGCDISGMGDDAVNVHDGLGYVSSLNGNTANVIASAMRIQPGDTIAFKNEKFENTNITAVVKSVRPLEGITKEIVFDRAVESLIKVGFTAFSTECDSSNYVIRNNYFHENRARGLLLQSSNGLCENNRFYKIMAQAVKVVMDIVPTMWQEGTGVDNLIIRGNTIEKCNFSSWGSVIEIGTNIAGRTAETFVFTNIEITGNTITDVPYELIKADNVNSLIISGNTFDTGRYYKNFFKSGRIVFGKYCDNVIYTDNSFINGGILNYKKIARAQDASVWAKVNAQL